MVRKDYTVREDQVKFLSQLIGNASEHIRAALDDYIAKKKKENLGTSSLSPSSIKKK